MEFAFQLLSAGKFAVTLQGAYTLLTSDSAMEDVIGFLAKEETPEAQRLISHYYSAFRSQPPEQLGGVKTTVGNYLKYFTDPDIAEVFCPEKSSFSLEDLDRGKIICVSLPQRYQVERRYTNTLLKLSFYTHALRRFDRPAATRATDYVLLGRALRGVTGGTLLFDEVEKAHTLVLDLFLQILEDARITLATGETLDLHGFYVVFTSNIGSAEAMRMESAPFASIERTVLSRVNQILRPELVGRVRDKVGLAGLIS